jgi:hypothetical protein
MNTATQQKAAPPAVIMTAQTALEAIKEKHPEEAKFFESIIRNNVLALGEDQAFALRDKDGELKAIKTLLRLSIQNGGLVKLPFGGPTDNIIVSAQGYEMWGEKAGAQVIFPETVLVDGQYQKNPAQLKDKDSDFAGWIISAVAFRLSPFGIPQVCERTFICDINNLMSIEFLAKAKKYKQAFQILPKGAAGPEEGGTWIEYPFDKRASLWVNSSHAEGLDWYSDISQMIKHSLQKALTQTTRNALKHLSGIQKAPTPVWDIPVICYRSSSGSIIKWDPTTYVTLKTKVAGLIHGDRSEFAQIELTKGTDIAGEEDELSTSEISEEDKFDAIEVNAANGKTLTEDDKRLFANFEIAKKEFREEFLMACQSLGLEPDSDFDAQMTRNVMAAINTIVDKG